MEACRNLVVLGVNKLIEDGLISLAASGNDARNESNNGHAFVTLAGHPSVVSWNEIGFDELRVSVWWKYDHSKHPQAEMTGAYKEQFHTPLPLAKRQHFPKFVGATVSAWIERKTGTHIQGKGRERLFDVYIRRGEKAELEAIPEAKPRGYKAEGVFFL